MKLRMLVAAALAAAAVVGGPTGAQASHNTCGIFEAAGIDEEFAEQYVELYLSTITPMSFSGKVKVSTPLGKVKVKVSVTIDDARSVDLVCETSTVSVKFDISVKLSGKLGSSTHNGTTELKVHYTLSPSQICFGKPELTALNLSGVNNKIDDWIRGKINSSSLTSQALPCVTL